MSRDPVDRPIELLRRSDDQSKMVVRVGDVVVFASGPRTDSRGLQADPSQPEARRNVPERGHLDQVAGTEQLALFELSLARPSRVAIRAYRIHRTRIVTS